MAKRNFTAIADLKLLYELTSKSEKNLLDAITSAMMLICRGREYLQVPTNELSTFIKRMMKELSTYNCLITFFLPFDE